MPLPTPKCKYGYPADQLQQILTPTLMEAFSTHMRGQTMTLCEGQEYSHELKKYIPTNCGPHGPVAYPWDLENFLKGRPPLD
jgi:hypothetical protein